MFGMGFDSDREMFSVRHPSMGVSISQLQTLWKENLPKLKNAIQPLTTQPIPGTIPLIPLKPAAAPAPASGSSALLWVGGLALLGVGGWYVATHPKTFGFGKKK